MNSTVRPARLGDEFILPWTTGTLESGVSAYHMALLRADLVALDPGTGSVRKVVALGEVLEDPSVGFVATDGGFPLRQAEATGGVGTRLMSEESVRLQTQMAQGLNGGPGELAAYLPTCVDFRCSEDGTMWMQPIDLEFGGLKGGTAWLEIAADGGVQEIRLPRIGKRRTL